MRLHHHASAVANWAVFIRRGEPPSQMSRLRSSALLERGFVLSLDLLAAAGLSAVVFGAAAFGVVKISGAVSQTIAHNTAYQTGVTFEDGLRAEARSALAIFTPPLDVGGQDNADGHEIDFYTKDADRNAHFWAYRTEPVGIQRYEYDYPTLAGAVNVRKTGTPIASAALVTQVITADQLPSDTNVSPSTKAEISAWNVPLEPWSVSYGYPGGLVSGGNYVALAHFKNSSLDDHLSLAVGTVPTVNLTVMAGNYNPTPAPLPNLGGLGNLFFAYPGVAAQNFTVQEANYIDPFTVVDPNCGPNIAQVSPAVEKPATLGASVTFQVVPSASNAGLCQGTVIDVYTSKNPLDRTRARQENVDVASAMVAAPKQLVFSYSGKYGAAPQSVAVTKTYDPYPIDISKSTGCAGVAKLGQQAIAVTAPAASAPATQTNLVVTPTAPTGGGCTINVIDQYGEVQQVQIVSYGALTVAPNRLGFPLPTSAALTFTANEPSYGGLYNVDTSQCGLAVAVAPKSRTGSTEVFTVTPKANTAFSGCNLKVTDDHGSALPVTVVVDPNLPKNNPGPCGAPAQWGVPNFWEPPNNSSPLIADYYAQVATDTGDGLGRTPTGNAFFGYWDQWNGDPPRAPQGPKGSFLLSVNTDCSVTYILWTESINEYIFDLIVEVDFLGVPGGLSVDTPSFGGGSPDQGFCFYGGQYANYYPMLPFNHCSIPQDPYGQPNPGRPGDTVPIDPQHDTVAVPYNGGTANAIRFVLTPDQNLTGLPLFSISHVIIRRSGNPGDFDYVDGTGHYGAGPSCPVSLYATHCPSAAVNIYHVPKS